jgi:hypothetical protein
MKLRLGKKKKKKLAPLPSSLRKHSKEPESEESSPNSWMITGEEIAEQFALQRMNQETNRPPEFYIKDGEDRRIQFRDDKPAAGIWQYSARFNGRWQRFTMPPNGETDRFKDAGLRPQLRAVYEIIDIDGYTDKAGKKHKNMARFFLVSSRLDKQIRHLSRKLGGLVGRTFSISRIGSGKDTVYQITPEERKQLPDAVRKLPRLSKEIVRFYAPPDAKKQRLIIGTLDEDTESGPY